MINFKKGPVFECNQCGREVKISKEGKSIIPVYCCGNAMKQKRGSVTKKKVASKGAIKKSTK